jgi:anti-sigma regulatory factor (Ser/Thr protein kinase)
MRETPFGPPDDRDIGETGLGHGIGARGGRPGAPAGIQGPASGAAPAAAGGPARAAGPVLGSITLARRPEEVATARRFVAKILGDRPETPTALLLTSEAVTNAVIHTTGSTVTVAVAETAGGVRVEVGDGGADTVPTIRDRGDLRPDGELREGGRGVLLIRRLAAKSGFRADESGLTYWFEL